MNANTPWGRADGPGTVIAPGITLYSTPSHGGIHLSDERLQAMPQALLELGTFCGHPAWFEEDCDINIVVLAFPDAFPPEEVRNAVAFINCGWWNKSLACRNWLNLTDAGNTTLERAKEIA